MSEIEFRSANLKKYINGLLQRGEDEKITEKDLKDIKSLRINKEMMPDFHLGDLVFFKELANLSLSNMDFGDNEATILGLINSIKTLSINNAKIDLSEKGFENLKLDDLIFTNCEGLDVSALGENSSINRLSIINCKNAILKGVSKLENLEELNLQNNKWLKDADLEDVWKSSKLKFLNLDGNKDINKKERDGLKISHEDEYRETEKKDWSSNTRDSKKKIRNISTLSEEEIKNLRGKEIELTAADKEFLKTPEGKEVLSKLGKNNKVSISLNNTAEMDLETLDELSEVCKIDKVCVKSGWKDAQDRGYSLETYKEIKKEINKIVDEVDPNLSEAEKYMAVRDKIVNTIKYDHAALNLDRSDSDFYDCRNLKNGLLNHTCVCAGYADIMKNVLSEIGIEAKYIEGEVPGGGLHAWNQVKLKGDDGKYHWYNDDPTWDANDGGRKYCLMTDKEFNRNHKALQGRMDDKIEKCDTQPPFVVIKMKSNNYRSENEFNNNTINDDGFER